jgi:PAS domain S-box-containing protein
MTPSRILIVEDDRIVARDIQQQLIRIGHTVVGITARGEDALPLTIRSRPNLVLMDIRLEGGIDGIDAAQQIGERCGVPVIYLTAYADDQTLRRAGVTEPFGYLLKPFEDSQLRTTIEMALYKHAAERKLRESERRYAVTLSSIGDAVIATDEKLQVTFMNPVAEALTGWSRTDAIGLPLAEVFRIINEDTRQTVENPAVKVLRLGVVVGLANHTILLARDGRERPIDDCGSPIVDDRGEITGIVLVFRDITQRRQTDETLREVQVELAHVTRVVTMGELVASIAHEVNQPLTGVVAHAGSCLRWLAKQPPDIEEARQALNLIVRDGKRAGEVIGHIRALVKKVPPCRDRLDINTAILEVIALAHRELQRNDVDLRTHLSSGLPLVAADRVQLQQVILNLIVNAIDAMSGVGDRPRELLVGTGASDSTDVMVEVRDSGPGLDPANLPRLFDSFYTTKAEGMGLGLSISRSIIEAHGGRIWATSNQPHGAVFRFTLPAEGDRTP